MSTGITCELLLDGQRFADGSAGDDVLAPTALSGLKVAWGRETTVDQPEPSTCEFEVMDLPGGPGYLTKLRTGRRIEVNATGMTYPDPDPPMMPDPGFENTPIGSMPPSFTGNADAAVVGVEAATVTNWAVGANMSVAYNSSSPAFWANTITAGVRRLDYLGPNPSTFNNALAVFLTAPQGPGAADPLAAPCHPGDVITARLKVRSDRRRTWSSSWGFFDSSGVQIGTNTVVTGVPAGPLDEVESWVTWTPPAVTAPAGAAFVRVQITSSVGQPNTEDRPTNVWFPGEWVEFTEPQIAIGEPLPEVFFNGDTPDTAEWSFQWTGVPQASPSTATSNPFRHVLMLPVDASRPASVAFAPADFSELPNAWDEIPATSPGQEWIVGATVQAPAGATITIGPVYFSRPTGVHVFGAQQLRVTASGDWQQLQLTVTPQVFGHWVGVQITVDSLRAWLDLPGSWLDTPGSWLDYEITLIDDLLVLAPAEGTPRTVSVFTGRITDLSASWDDGFSRPEGGFGGTRIHVTAQDFTADLANINIGDEPWQVEALESRFDRIVELSGFDVEAQIDDSIAGTLISYQDVDNQPVAGLLQDLAQSVDAVLWAAVHQTTGPYLRVEDPSNRAALFTLAVDEAGLVQIIASEVGRDAQTIAACDVLRDPVQWQQSVSDISSRVAVTWLEQGVNDEGRIETTERTYTLIDTALEEAYGYRRIGVSTMLQAEADARHVADRILARTSLIGWRSNGFTIDDSDSLEQIDQTTIAMLLHLLDGTTRIGLPLRLTDMPEWTPAGSLVPVYLEGGDYTFDDGAWTLALTASQATAQGGSVPWADLNPTWSWLDFDPGISWLDLTGVAYTPPPTGETS